ncbi:MAG: hypothetical protein Q8M02_10270 [Candidatus Didemnitutus sp.]|nr:hypothetical protein [Candidatus Didemnitutus sp.]
MSARLNDWPERLAALIKARRSMPFAWGSHDCCQFARAGITAITGQDPARGFGLRRYRTERAAAAILRRLGGIEALLGRAGFVEIRIALAQRGDVMLLRCPSPTLGLCLGTEVAVPTADGLTFYPALQAARAWRIG